MLAQSAGSVTLLRSVRPLPSAAFMTMMSEPSNGLNVIRRVLGPTGGSDMYVMRSKASFEPSGDQAGATSRVQLVCVVPRTALDTDPSLPASAAWSRNGTTVPDTSHCWGEPTSCDAPPDAGAT